jgi:purine-nucleoside phosphorylase
LTNTPTPHNAAAGPTSAANSAQAGDIAKAVLMPGDPLRAKYVAETFLTDAFCFNTVRNMLGFTGAYKGKRLSVMGSGMGIPSIGLYTYELYHFYQVESVIRIGSAGGLAPELKLRDVVIAMSAGTDSHFADHYDFPGILAPTADFSLLRDAVSVAEEKKGVAPAVGPVFSSDVFYHTRPDIYQAYRQMGLLALEMETAGLYLTAARAGKKALSVLTITDHLLTGEGLDARERQETLRDMIEIALDTAWRAL